MRYSLARLAVITDGELMHDHGNEVFHLATDSRQIVHPSGAMFAAIRGDHRDGHGFVADAYRLGVRSFLVDQDVDLPHDAAVLRVHHTLAAIQQIAAFHRAQFDIPVAGITGSNGKTIVKEWLNTLLADDYTIARSPRSYNSQLGVPLSLLNLDTEHTLGIFEAGISSPGEMEALRGMIRPTIGILTTIGSAHAEHFSSRAQIAQEKAILFDACPVVIAPADQHEVTPVLVALRAAGTRVWSWGRGDTADLRVTDLRQMVRETRIEALVQGLPLTFVLPFTDHASVENALCCFTVLLALGYAPERIAERILRLERLPMRTEIVKGSGDSVIVNDSWSADLDSLRIALDVLRHHAQRRPLRAVITDIPQSGLSPEELYRRVNELLVSAGIGEVYTIGSHIHSALHLFTLPVHHFLSPEELQAHLVSHPPQHVAMLVKGAREYRLERLVHALEEKSHESYTEIDLAALSHNLNVFKSRLHLGTRIMVMVKAFGYGSGARETAALLEFSKVDYLAVAYADEGVVLREAGISLPIMVMNPSPGSLSTMLRHRLEPEIFSFRILGAWREALQREEHTEPRAVHIKIDTGMHRLGFDPSDVPRMLEELSHIPSLRVASVFTHLAASESPEHDAFTHEQLNRYTTACAMIAKVRQEPFLRHVLNTGGIERFPDYQLDMVRLGIGLYGVSASGSQRSLQPVIRMISTISQKRHIRAGESVGYSRSFVASQDMEIGVIPLGYADGLRRVLSNGAGAVSVGGKRAPIIGRVCMDMTMIDLTGIPCEEGEQVELFGRDIPLAEFSSWNGTIPYEILTTIGQRVRRVYIRE